jgi:DNA-binding response OmpR family regulator
LSLHEAKRILFTHPDRKTRDLAEALSSPERFSVRAAATMAEAMEKTRSKPFDLYVIHRYLPDGSGIELTFRIAKLHPGASMIFFPAEEFQPDGITAPKGAVELLTRALADAIARTGGVRRFRERKSA